MALSDNLLAAYLVNNRKTGNGTVVDESGNGLHLLMQTGTNAALQASDRTKLRFTAGGRRAEIYHGDNAAYDRMNFVGTDWTFHCRVRFNALTEDGIIFTYSNSDASQRAIQIYFANSDDKIKALLDAGTPTAQPVSASTVTTGVDYLLTVTYDQSTVSLYLDDAAAVTASLTGPLDEIETAGVYPRFGQRRDADVNSDLDADLDRIMFWERALTGEEVATLHTDLWVPTQVTAERINVVIQIGQSNGVGVTASSTLTGGQAITPVGCLLADGRAADTGTKYFRSAIDGAGENANMGPEIAMAESLGDGWAIIKYCESGTGLAADWQVGDTTWTAARAHITEMLAELVRLGYDVGAVVVAHVAGEADSISEDLATAYKANWELLFTEIEGVVGKRCYAAISRLSDEQAAHAPYVYLSTVQAQQDAIAAADPTYRTVINTDDLAVRVGDENHYTADSIYTIGQRLAAAAKVFAGAYISATLRGNSSSLVSNLAG